MKDNSSFSTIAARGLLRLYYDFRELRLVYRKFDLWARLLQRVRALRPTIFIEGGAVKQKDEAVPYTVQGAISKLSMNFKTGSLSPVLGHCSVRTLLPHLRL